MELGPQRVSAESLLKGFSQKGRVSNWARGKEHLEATATELRQHAVSVVAVQTGVAKADNVLRVVALTA